MRANRLLTLPLLIAAFGFAACGDDSSPSEETAAAPTEVATEAPTEAAPEATEAPTEEGGASSSGESGVKVSGKAGEAPEIEVPKGGTPPSELIIEDIKKGKGNKAAAGQTVSVQYYGALYKDGTKFDASWDRGGEPFEFQLGAGMVIPGWDQGLEGMQAGGRRVLTIPPDLAYGPNGSGPIGPNETLVFVVDMEEISSP
jgi:peptidylprolyl isomerase